MEITKFEFIDKGYGGIKITYDELTKTEGNHSFKDKLDRIRKFPVSKELIAEVQKLKYFFLNAAGYWIPPYSKYFDSEKYEAFDLPAEDPKNPHIILKELLNRTYVTKAEVKNGGFSITGQIEAVANKPMKVTTALITADDDFSLFHDCIDVLNSISDGIKRFIGKHKFVIDNPEKVLSNKAMIGKSDEEVMELALQKFVDNGGVILMPEEDQQESLEENNKKEDNITVHKSGNIDKENLSNAEEESSDEGKAEFIPRSDSKINTDDQIRIPNQNNISNMPDGFISDDEKVQGPEPGEDMSRFEHSENMGVDEQDDIPSTDNKEW